MEPKILSSIVQAEYNTLYFRMQRDGYPLDYMNIEYKPNFKEVGKVFGKDIKEYQDKLLKLTDKELTSLQKKENITMNINSKDYDITPDMVDIRYIQSDLVGQFVDFENADVLFIYSGTILNQNILK